jgi:hypothetical protein
MGSLQGGEWMKPTKVIAVDFDGVLHDPNGAVWVTNGTIPGIPISGAMEWLNSLRRSFVVAIHSCRSATPMGREAMRDWLKQYISEGDLFNIYFPEHKPYAAVYIDDKGFRFNPKEGFPSVEFLEQLDTWEIHNHRNFDGKDE